MQQAAGREGHWVGAWVDTEDQRRLVMETLSFSNSKTERGFGPGVPGWRESKWGKGQGAKEGVSILPPRNEPHPVRSSPATFDSS